MPIDISSVNKASAVHAKLAERSEPTLPDHAVKVPAPIASDAGVSVEADSALAATTPPVDAERVAEIRRAIEDGSYPVIPTRIADAMIAARLMLSTSQ